ncbi:MAG TPA: FAD-dependent oxidoreductase [Burkholderiaceae bacterium]|nr:FAD-dependent oxidoreductase [Burkholderiaceae bacterium]
MTADSASSTDFDVIVVGAGAAGMTAACVAAAERQRVLLVEQASLVGGTTAISGGMVWIPVNHKMAEAGQPDSAAAALDYLRATVPSDADPAPLAAFVARGDEALRYLESRTALRLRPVMRYPDYYPDLPGATLGGRVLEPMPFDGRVLGEQFAWLRPPLPEFLVFGGMMVHRSDMPHLRRATRSPASAWRVARLLARHALERTRASRGTTLHLGNALAGWLLHSALELGVELRRDTAVSSLLVEGGRVVGIDAVCRGASRRLTARRGVVLACGGMSRDASLRQRYLPPLAGPLSAAVCDGPARSGARLAQTVGAQLSRGSSRQALWVPGSALTRPDGTSGVFPHTVTDRGKPGLIAVDHHGRRFVNEALSYHEFVLGQLRAGTSAIPAFLICDRRFLWRYGLGAVRPFTLSPAPYVARGYLKCADTLAGLAEVLGVPSGEFAQTVAAFNAGAARGVDTLFGRGGDAYQRHLGDADHQPNPCVAPIDRPPFYAVAVAPADLGVAAGLVTDADARVLDETGRPIAGLYACGNDMQSVMNGAYPGPGITLGPALVFGYLAARHAARS